MSRSSLIRLQEFTRKVPIANDLRERAVSIVSETRDMEELDYGASPRASMNIVLAAKGRALIEGRNHVSEKDIDSMAKPVLRHRIGLSFQAEKKGLSEDKIVDQILEEK